LLLATESQEVSLLLATESQEVPLLLVTEAEADAAASAWAPFQDLQVGAADATEMAARTERSWLMVNIFADAGFYSRVGVWRRGCVG
jgi:hypothetical protein